MEPEDRGGGGSLGTNTLDYQTAMRPCTSRFNSMIQEGGIAISRPCSVTC